MTAGESSLPQTMKTSYRTTYGGPEILSVQQAAVPTPAEDEVLIRVRASTVNRTDCGVLWGAPFVFRFFTGLFKPRFSATGTDFAGEVAAIGAKVTGFKVGDRVWGFRDEGRGSHAQYFAMKESAEITTIPEGISFETAAASAEGAHYAINFINKVTLKPGDKVLVNGATGAIGSAAVQLLKNEGIFVTATCATKHVDAVRALGADRVIDYLTDDFTKDADTYAFVFDAVGKSTFGQCKALLAPKGIYLSSELGPNMQNPLLALVGPFMPGKRVIFPVPTNIKGSLKRMSDLLAQRKFKPLIDRPYPLESIAEAFTYVNSGQKIGNVILTFD
jgi:NADPH:quinone reductase-like Zn-dependent oxidoreductase